ncbi:lipopolysaccharide biosynthesis protein [Desulfofarcimen acetoxidans DSM 771]|uniref:Lipopolysaccharide biosynthesis protein n=1 Tax=Desulfofarcimen acetoxidans (strain ATCC 49208 / DSM 771 / KCTC 5769 / VKM B-1644 / 5575) TaxID=485916 RepID=C8W5K3_DESAS|nr:Wzz/FepE/Etk N-terminal domain-containing protein [Desulfofarcimen acetoxidans]ACV64003.1 lipopolysaccharide biosynthesis protein [Desulfofarcimen acetoxidans DSM 771]
MELEIKDIIRILKKGKLLLLILPFIAVLTSGIISYYFLTPVYSATATILVNNKSQRIMGGLDYQDIMLSTELAKTYSKIAVSRTVAEKVLQVEKLDITPDQFIGKVSVQPVKESQLINITVVDPNPNTAAHLANITSRVFVEIIVDIMELNTNGAKVIDIAIPSNSPIKPNEKLNILIAGLLSLMIAIGILLLREFIDQTVKSNEDIERYFGLPVYGNIPKIK